MTGKRAPYPDWDDDPHCVFVAASDNFDNPLQTKGDLQSLANQMGVERNKLMVLGLRENVASTLAVKTARKYHPRAPSAYVRTTDWKPFYVKQWTRDDLMSVWDYVKVVLLYRFQGDDRSLINLVRDQARERSVPILERKITRRLTGKVVKGG